MSKVRIIFGIIIIILSSIGFFNGWILAPYPPGTIFKLRNTNTSKNIENNVMIGWIFSFAYPTKLMSTGITCHMITTTFL
jgi:hypothetical protein